jgi:hypothetical protein
MLASQVFPTCMEAEDHENPSFNSQNFKTSGLVVAVRPVIHESGVTG